MLTRIFGDRRHSWAFWLGCLAVTAGVVLHLPMYWMSRNMGFRLSGMAMDGGMLAGMALILGGIALAAFGLLPRTPGRGGPVAVIAPPEDASLTRAHWSMCGLLALALVIDIMKPASLGFVTPGMRAEYDLSKAMVALLPFAALSGTVAGSFLWGVLADIYGRRASILLSSVMFVGTSICGAMPDFWWNVGMCFLMGAAAGGMLPVAYALLAEIMPTRHRGWSLVLVGGIGAVGGYFAASGLSALLQPYWGWRIMWFLNLPTGLILIALSPFLPESARFLQHTGRGDEARAMLARFGAAVQTEAPVGRETVVHAALSSRKLAGIIFALTLAALGWGFVNFGVLLWLPSALVAEGISVQAASGLIARSTLIAAPTVLVSVWLYSRWSTRGALQLALALTALGLFGLMLRGLGVAGLANPVPPLALLVVGSSAVISILLPYTAENFPLRIRGRATGWIAGCSKLGGLIAQAISVLNAAPPIGVAAGAIGVLVIAAAGSIMVWGRETRDRDLRDLEPVALTV